MFVCFSNEKIMPNPSPKKSRVQTDKVSQALGGTRACLKAKYLSTPAEHSSIVEGSMAHNAQVSQAHRV